MLTQTEFNAYAGGGFNRVPLVREVLADLETPLSVYMKLAGAPYSYLLESVQGGEKWGRYSMIGLPCRRRIEVRGNRFREIDFDYDNADSKNDTNKNNITDDKNDTDKNNADGTNDNATDKNKNNDNIAAGDTIIRELVCDDPLAEIRAYKAQHRVPEISGMPRFSGGLVGFFGYDTVRFIEPHLGANAAAEPIGAPDILLLVSDEVVVFDNLAGRLYVIVHADPATPDAWVTGKARLDELLAQLGGAGGEKRDPVQSSPAETITDDINESEITSSFPREKFEAAVEKCRAYIYEGDVFQVVISQRMSLPFDAPPLDLYRALRH